jgi:hypothetical protein
MTAGKRRVRVPALLLAALAALLVLAATASAETRAGESTTVLSQQTPTPEATIVKAGASYETSGNATFTVTTAGVPSAESEGEIWGALFTSSNCGTGSGETLFNEIFFETPPPILLVEGKFATAGALGITGSFFAPKPVTATKSASETTTTLTGTSSELANAGFNCAFVAASDKESFNIEGVEGVGSTLTTFPLTVQATPPSTVTSPSAGSRSQSPATTLPAPPVLSIGKLKPVTLKPGKWRTVKVKVTNTGPSASAAGSLRLKASKGVLARPERQQLPVLAPGRSFSLSFRVQLTAKARKHSTVSLTASAPGASATSSLVLKKL